MIENPEDIGENIIIMMAVPSIYKKKAEKKIKSTAFSKHYLL